MAFPASEDDLRNDINPTCPHDNSIMIYEPTELALRNLTHPSTLDRFLPSYRCVEIDCTARFRHTQGYFTLKGPLEAPKMVPIPGVNIEKCPKHGYWLYMRARSGSEKNITWCCAVRGCDHTRQHSDIPGTWAR